MDPTLKLLIIGWVFVLIWVPFVIYSNRKVHPGALFVCFGAEMWERFSYYGMRALLTLFMVKVLFLDMGQQVADVRALGIYGSYTSMVYLFPVLGGLIADRVWGFRKTIVWGGILMMLGHFTLALMGLPTLEDNLWIFFAALALIITGNGFFKPNIASFLGEFYEPNDARKDGAFTIFYMGVNIGAFLATLTCGYVGEKINWHYGFGLAGIGMALGIVFFILLAPRVFGSKGLKPKTEEPDPLDETQVAPPVRALLPFISNKNLVYLGSVLFVPMVAIFLNFGQAMATALLVISVVVIGYMVYISVTNTDKKEGQRLLVVIVLFFFHVVFWALFEQAGGSLTLFTDRNVDRNLFGSEIPASVFQSLNPFYIVVLAPVFSWMWIRLNRAKLEPSTPMKFVLGLAQLGLGYLIIVLGARLLNVDGMVPVILLFLMYLLHTTGELFLSPVGLSMVTKLSPAKIVGFTMGAWYLSIALANKLAGEIGKLTASDDLALDAPAADTLPVYLGTYQTWGVFVVFGAALLLLLLVPMLRKWMHGIH